MLTRSLGCELPGNSDNAITQDGLYEFELGKYLLSKGRPGRRSGCFVSFSAGSRVCEFCTACACPTVGGCLDEAVQVLTLQFLATLRMGFFGTI